MLERLALAYSSGLLAAVSPCVLVLIPLCLVRFVQPTDDTGSASPSGGVATKASAGKGSLYIQLLQFLVGFQISYLLFGFALAEVLTSRIQSGVKLALGLLFLVSSVLAWCGRVDPLRLPMVESAWATGASFALLLSVNPCTVPFLAMLISLSAEAPPAHTVLALLAFGQGLITPALGVVLAGSRVLKRLESAAFKLERLKSIMFVLLGASGLYLLASDVHIMASGDLAVAAIGLVLAVALVHHAAQKPINMTNKTCEWDPIKKAPRCYETPVDQPPLTPARLAIPIVAAALLVALLLATTLVYDHNSATHTAIDAAYADAQTQAVVDPAALEIRQHANTQLAATTPGGESGEPRGPLQQLKRQLTGAANGLDTAAGAGSISAATPLDAASDEADYHHLDQDAGEVPSIVPTPLRGSIHAPHHSESHLDEHVAPLSQVDLDALAALGQGAPGGTNGAEDDSRCVDLSMVPPCASCRLTVWTYRLLALLLALVALWGDALFEALWPLDSRTRDHTPRTPSSLLERPRALWATLVRFAAPNAQHKEQTLTL